MQGGGGGIKAEKEVENRGEYVVVGELSKIWQYDQSTENRAESSAV